MHSDDDDDDDIPPACTEVSEVEVVGVVNELVVARVAVAAVVVGVGHERLPTTTELMKAG
jgi:hypothetical protein